jgi:hypothetical protein
MPETPTIDTWCVFCSARTEHLAPLGRDGAAIRVCSSCEHDADRERIDAVCRVHYGRYVGGGRWAPANRCDACPLRSPCMASGAAPAPTLEALQASRAQFRAEALAILASSDPVGRRSSIARKPPSVGKRAAPASDSAFDSRSGHRIPPANPARRSRT